LKESLSFYAEHVNIAETLVVYTILNDIVTFISYCKNMSKFLVHKTPSSIWDAWVREICHTLRIFVVQYT